MTLTFNCGALAGTPRVLYAGRFHFSGRIHPQQKNACGEKFDRKC